MQVVHKNLRTDCKRSFRYSSASADIYRC